MRRYMLLIYAFFACLSLAPTGAALAQAGGRGGGGGPDSADDAAKKKRDEEWNTTSNLDLPGRKNAGPCPYVKVLYDAGRYIEFKDNKVASNAVGYTGEIQNLSSGCAYKDIEPIQVKVELLFAFGRGPQASQSNHTYRYWVAVTDRNLAVLDKEYFDIDAKFPEGQDRVFVTDRINTITIPRATNTVSGANFEVLIGFDVTPEMADFNRQGKRFRLTAGGATPTAASVQTAQ